MNDAWLHFLDGLHLYIYNFMMQGAKIGNKPLVVPTVDYHIDNMAELIEKNWEIALVHSSNITDLIPELKVVAEEFLPKFLKEHPEYKDAECLKLMKTFESEKRELFDWLHAETEKHFAEVHKMIAEHKLSRDSEEGRLYQEKVFEYNRRLVALKVKYNIPTTEHELLHWGDYVE